MPLGDFDYRVMRWIRDADFCTMDLLVGKFGEGVRATVESLYRDRLLHWDRPIDNLWGHDDAKSKIELLPEGERALNNFVESERLTRKSVWAERRWGIAATLITELLLWLFTHLDTIAGWLQTLLSVSAP